MIFFPYEHGEYIIPFVVIGSMVISRRRVLGVYFITYSFLNRIQGKSVHARAFALERQQSPVSYVGINIVSRTILKIMYRTISNSTFDDESR